MGEVPEVLILGIVGLAVDLEGDVVRLGVVDLLLAGLDAPLPPRGDDGHIGRERLDGELETHLIVALARAAVADGVGVLRLCYLHDALGDDGTRKGGAQHIFLVLRTRLDGGDDVLVHEFVGEILDVQLGRARFQRLFLEPFKLVRLPYVAGDRDDFAVVVVLFEPRDDDGSVQAARVCQHDFLYLALVHKLPAVLRI